MRKGWKIVAVVLLATILVFTLSSCGFWESKIHELNGAITGNTYNANFYTNNGKLFMTCRGKKITMTPNIIKEPVYTDGGWGYTETMSSVMTITIDGKQLESCGTTIIFAEDGLKPDVDYLEIGAINSEADGFFDNTFVAKIVNKYKNMIGKPVAVVIQSQLGDPICSYSGRNVYWEVCDDLPKTTKLMIDGKALYIHRANFQIVDAALL